MSYSREFHLLLDVIAKAENLDYQTLQSDIASQQFNTELLHQLYTAAIKREPGFLSVIPELHRTRELCLLAISKNGLMLEHVPIAFRDIEICTKSIKKNAGALRFLQNPEDRNLSLKEYRSVCLTAVGELGLVLEYVPIEMRDLAMCLTSVGQNGFALTIIEDINDTVLSPSEFRDVCLLAVSLKGRMIEYIADPMREFEFYLASITQDGRMLSYIEVEANTALTESEYKVLRLTAVKQNGLALQYIPMAHRDLELSLAAVMQNGLALQYVDSNNLEIDPTKLWEIAVKQNGLAIKYVPKAKRVFDLYFEAISQNAQSLEVLSDFKNANLSAAQYLQLCIMAVKQNPLLLKYVDEAFKKKVIDAISLNKLLTNNYNVIQYIPASYQFHVQLFLAKVTHVVVTEENAMNKDGEIRDVYSVYSEHPQRAGKIVHVDGKAGLIGLLKEIHQYSGNPNLNLVLLGHANTEKRIMADLRVTDIVRLLSQDKDISKITLLGCRTAAAQPLAEEVNMKQRFRHQMQTNNLRAFTGVMLMSEMPDEQNYPAYFKKMSVDNKNHNSNQLFILVRQLDKPAVLVVITPDLRQTIELNENSLKEIEKIIGNNKKVPTAKKGLPTYYRGGKSAAFLTPDDSLKVFDLATSDSYKFSKDNLSYKQQKKAYPFLTDIEIDESEDHKMLPSFLKSVTEAIKGEPKIKREIAVKGYTKSMHVDKQEKQLKGTKTYLYSSEYKKSLSEGALFFSGKDNIDRKELARQHEKELKDMLVDKKKSKAKSITVKIKK